MKKLRYLILLLPLTLSGCFGGQEGGGIDLIALTKNPVVMVIIGGAVLYFAFKMKH